MNYFDKLIVDAVGISANDILLVFGIVLGMYWFIKKII